MRRVVLAASAALVVAAGGRGAAAGPRYASPESRRWIERMLEAHGGLERWRGSPTVSFRSELEVSFGGGQWVPYREEVVAERATRRVYARLPNPDGSAGRIAFDGRTAWSAGELRGIAQAPARFTAWRNLYLFTLPFMTQDDGVFLGEPVRRPTPLGGPERIAIPMTFGENVGDTPRDRYWLYLDPDTARLRAAEYVMTYASMMGGKDASPASCFVWEETSTVDGLVVPTRYTVYWSGDGSVAVRGGRVSDWSFRRPFDPSQLEMPEGGTPDRSSPR